MKYTFKRIAICIAFLATPIILPLSASAHELAGDDTSDKLQHRLEAKKEEAKNRIETKKAETQSRIEAKKVEIQQKIADKKVEIRQKLDNSKKKICEKRQQNINKQMNRVVTQRNKQITHIDDIFNKVQDFYDKKDVTVPDYDAIVADISVKKAAAVAALDTVKPTEEFSCNGTGPKADLKEFNGKRNVAVDAIREYRESVRKLITAVKSASAIQEKNNE